MKIINSKAHETEKPYYHFRPATCRLWLYTGTVHPSHCSPRLLENRRFGTEFHCRTGESRLHKLLRFRVRCMAHRRQPTCSKPRQHFQGSEYAEIHRTTVYRRHTGQRRATPHPAAILGEGRTTENAPYSGTEIPQDTRTGNTCRRKYRERW